MKLADLAGFRNSKLSPLVHIGPWTKIKTKKAQKVLNKPDSVPNICLDFSDEELSFLMDWQRLCEYEGW